MPFLRNGSKSGSLGRCYGCQGTGSRTTSRRIGPGMIQRIQHVCAECRGSGAASSVLLLSNLHMINFDILRPIWIYFDEGEMINERDRCSQCKGEKIVQEKKVLEVNVEKGMHHNQKIVFSGEADEAVSWINPLTYTHALTHTHIIAREIWRNTLCASKRIVLV